VTSLPDSLIRFGGDLERAIARDLSRRPPARSRRTMAARVGVALVAAGAVGAVVATLPGRDTPIVGGVVDPASAAERAAAVLSPDPGSLVHEVAVHRTVAPGGAVTSWREEDWRETAAPYRRREVMTRPDGMRIETAEVGSQPAQLYDPATNTIYTDPPDSAPSLGTPAPAGDGDPLRQQIVQLLRSGDARDVSHQVVGGRDAIRFVFRDTNAGGGAPTWTYVVDAATFRPIQLTVEAAGDPADTISFETYDVDDDDAGLLTLRGAHPGAAVDQTEAGYEAALARLR